MKNSMSLARQCVSHVVWLILVPLAATLVVCILFLAAVWLIMPLHGCDTVERGRISGVSGHDFVISARYCFGFGADSTVSVFISWHGRGKKTLLFRYDPVTEEDLPVIVSVARHRILIAVRDISSLIFRRDRVNDLTITYDIGHVHFPDTDGADKQ